MIIMHRRAKTIISTLILLPILIFGQEKIAQTGLQFLFVKSDAKAAAMGEAMTAVESYSSSSALFFNPATMALMKGKLDLSVSSNSWIADIQHNNLSLSYKPGFGNFGIFGLTVQFVDYGEMQGTAVWANGNGYYDTEIFNPTAMAMGLGYAKKLNDKLAIGTHIKSAHQYLGKSISVVGKNDSLELKNQNESEFAVDFGTYLRTGFKSLAFGMTINNFSKELKYEQESFQLPLNFILGISMDLMDLMGDSNKNSLILAVDATHPRSHAEQLKIGLDYTFLNTFSIRGGYIHGNDENDISFGAGIRKFNLAVDYALIPFGVFGYVTQLTVRCSL